jgi:hypothetical protein
MGSGDIKNTFHLLLSKVVALKQVMGAFHPSGDFQPPGEDTQYPKEGPQCAEKIGDHQANASQ